MVYETINGAIFCQKRKDVPYGRLLDGRSKEHSSLNRWSCSTLRNVPLAA